MFIAWYTSFVLETVFVHFIGDTMVTNPMKQGSAYAAVNLADGLAALHKGSNKISFG